MACNQFSRNGMCERFSTVKLRLLTQPQFFNRRLGNARLGRQPRMGRKLKFGAIKGSHGTYGNLFHTLWQVTLIPRGSA
jgi:hypothetical protein